jgi:hypothetical protein
MFPKIKNKLDHQDTFEMLCYCLVLRVKYESMKNLYRFED